MKYDANYFINKFEAIPEDKWITGNYGTEDRHCALGHCGVSRVFNNNNVKIDFHATSEGSALWCLFNRTHVSSVIGINDGRHPDYQQPTPKQRILAALYDIRENTIKAIKPVVENELVNV
jgi:hypothetical protein